MFESFSDKTQFDRQLRSSARYNRSWKRLRYRAIAGFTSDVIRYKDGVSSTDADNRSQTYNLFNTLSWYAGNNIFVKSSLDGMTSVANTSNYGSIDPLSVFSLTEEFAHNAKKIRTRAGVKILTSSSDAALRLLPYASLRVLIGESQQITAGYVHGARYPGLNDLYWEPGGNPELKTERSIKSSVGWSLNGKVVSSAVRLYSAWIYDMIQWLPNDQGLFQATQLTNRITNNYGAEADLSLRIPVGKSEIRFRGSYGYTVSVRDIENRDVQNIYVPFHRHTSMLQWKGRDLFAIIGYSVTSERYTDVSNLSSLPMYELFNSTIGWERGGINGYFRASNIFNEQYQLQSSRPMPGRSWQFGFTYTLQKNDQND